jgi:hypothetical protein
MFTLLLIIWLSLSGLAALLILASCVIAGMADQYRARTRRHVTPLDTRARELSTPRLAAGGRYLTTPLLAARSTSSRRRRSTP